MESKLRKIISIMVCVVMVLTCIAVSKTATTSAAAGTADDPVLIKTADDLKAAVKSTSKTYYKLANDIVINDITVKIENGVGVIYNAEGTAKLTEDEIAELTPWFNEGYADTASRFKGTLDGDGHIIRGLYLDADAPYEKGGDDYKYARALISYAGNGAAIKNLGLEDAYVSYEYGTASGFIANIQRSQVSAENCYVGKSAYFYGHNASAFFGGGDQNQLPTSVKNCYSQATLKLQEGVSDTRFGAIYADCWNCSATLVENFYTTTKLSHAGVTKVANVYDYVKATQGYIGTAFEGNTFLPADTFCAVEGQLPTLKYFKGIPENVWSGIGDKDIAGAGTSADPYLITSGEELAYVVYKKGDINPNASNEWFKLANDIYLNDVFAEKWKENTNNYEWYSTTDSTDFKTKKFSGNIDGNGYCVYGIWYPEDSTAFATGLVPGIGAYTIKNIGIKQSQIVAKYYAGAFVGYCSDGAATKILSCFSDETVDVIHNDASINGGAGGIVGYHMGGSTSSVLLIENCYSAANCSSVASTTRANGMIGTIWNGYHKVVNCYSLGNAPYYADTSNRVSLLAYDGTLVKYTDANDNEISGKPTDNSNYKIVYKDYTDTYTYNSSKGSYTSARKYTSYSKLDKAYINNYGSVSKAVATSPEGYKSYTNLNASAMTGKNALENMKDFDSSVWYAVDYEGAGPMHRVHGTAIGDVNEDGIGLGIGDDEALRKALIGVATAPNGDYNHSGEINVVDLLAIILDRNDLDSSECPHYFKGELVTKPTATVDGIVNHTCRRCDYSYEENIGNSIKILAIGNSFTVDGTQYLYDILTDAGIENVVLQRLTIGGSDLDIHWNNIVENNAAYYSEKYTAEGRHTSTASINSVISEEDWDFITIQQVSTLSGVPEAYDNLPAIINFLDENKTNEDAKIYWQMPWAYQHDCTQPGFANFNKDQITMYNAIVNVVKEKVLTEELIDGVIPSGTTIQNMRTSYLGDTLTRDGYHASLDYGRYAINLTWLKALTGNSLDNVDWVPEDYPYLADSRDLIYEAVNNAIENPYVITNSTYTVAP